MYTCAANVVGPTPITQQVILVGPCQSTHALPLQGEGHVVRPTLRERILARYLCPRVESNTVQDTSMHAQQAKVIYMLIRLGVLTLEEYIPH